MSEEYFEALLHLIKRDDQPLPLVRAGSHWIIAENEITEQPGLFCLWWDRPERSWSENGALKLRWLNNREPYQIVPLTIQSELVRVRPRHKFPLLLENAHNIRKRLEWQLMLEIPKVDFSDDRLSVFSLNISPFRRVIDQVYNEYDDVRPLFTSHLRISQVTLPDDRLVPLRTFLFHYALGNLRPICNIDFGA
ncbi:MAG: hypothetical protein GF403_08850 [Candidatus Coatesbacteria bacterium]|nr:hypothetical protein [Candidatus Coatesbacteria bacterium]